MNGDPLVVLDRVAVGYGRHAVLKDVTFALERGSFTALLGANGCGKSTVLKTLAGILPPLGGELRRNGAAGAPLLLGYVPQRETLDPMFLLSGFEVAHMGTFRRVRPGRIAPRDERQQVLDCLRLTGAEDFAHRQFSELSGGQKQRILIARALAARPELLLLDEPTAGIDTAAAAAVMEVRARLNLERKLAILLVTHDLGSVRRHVPNVLWLHQGKVLRGTVAEWMTPERIGELLAFSLG